MSNTFMQKPPVWFWIVAIIFIVWNLFGCANYLMAVTATAEGLTAQGYTAEQTEFLLNVPPLFTSVFALAVWSGLLGSLLLLLRRRVAVPVFLVSLVFVLLSFILDAVGGTFRMLGSQYLIIMSVVTVLAFIEVWFSRLARKKAWLR